MDAPAPELVAELRSAGCVFAEEEARLLTGSGAPPELLRSLVARRVAGEPLEHLLGRVDFCGLRIELDPGVFIPRQRTEALVRQAAAAAPPGAVLVDLCCGSGAVGRAVLERSGPRELHAVDVDPAAVRCARRNLAPVGGQVYVGDLFAPLPARLRGRVGLLVANVPYVPTGELDGMPVEAREHEPRATHDGGPDGLDVLRRVLAAAPDWLAPGAAVLVEISEGQAGAARAAFAAAGLGVEIVTSTEPEATVAVGRAGRG